MRNDEVVVKVSVLERLLADLEASAERNRLAELCVEDALTECILQRQEEDATTAGMAIVEVIVGPNGGLVIETEGLTDDEAEKIGRKASEVFMGFMRR